MEDSRLAILSELQRKVLWLATWTIHNANHIRPNPSGLKVGGHQASSASLATVMTALYFAVLRPEDRVAVKPHASPIFHAIQYLFGQQTLEKLQNFRGFKGAQSYPSRTKDIDDVDFSTGSVGLGVAQTLFASLVQDYVRAKGWGLDRPEGHMVALIGDAEMDEGNIFEAWPRAGSTASARRGGWWTTTARAWTRWCAKGCGRSSRRCSATSAGTWWCCATAGCRRRPSPKPGGERCQTGSRPARTSSIRR